MLFAKLGELLMVHILAGQTSFSFSIDPAVIGKTVLLFGVIFGVIFLNALRQIHLTNPIALLHSEALGEKPPKANWLLAILGLILLLGAYYLAVTIQDPLSTLLLFFVAVIMVILATYLSVSYTHLDVYKRQGSPGQPLGPMGPVLP